MVDALIDTSIIIDILRNYPPANEWANKRSIQIGITQAVYLEVLDGVTDKDRQRNALKLLKRFELVRLAQSDFEWATDQLIQYKLSHNVGMMDCLIASVSHRLQLPLYTGNLKHFAPILGALAAKPYP